MNRMWSIGIGSQRIETIDKKFAKVNFDSGKDRNHGV